MTEASLVALLAARPLLTKQDLARRFCVTVRTIEIWRAAGKLPRPVVISGPRWRPEDVDTFEQKQSK
jgi:hypothetical protein